MLALRVAIGSMPSHSKGGSRVRGANVSLSGEVSRECPGAWSCHCWETITAAGSAFVLAF